MQKRDVIRKYSMCPGRIWDPVRTGAGAREELGWRPLPGGSVLLSTLHVLSGKPALQLCREGLESCETLPSYVMARCHDACNLLSNGLGEKMLIYAESPKREQGGERKSESSCVKREQLRSGVE